MTTTRIYSCNLCRTAIPDDASGRGVYFLTSRIAFKPLREVEHHICNNCVRSVIEAAASAPLTSTESAK